ncbi:hypothetical protein [Vibrio intestinalis]|uniref:hypothetical protein n=1 Tax=Vibrio intestinalis TaxID=2933291 RepID=UPI0021A4E5CE|nr:hypothetical protein [Vibrio intestinalis]
MQSAKFAALFALPALLAGCGGSSSDGGGNSTPPPPAKYTINFLKLANVNVGQEGSCDIYGQDSDTTPTKYTLAYSASGQNMSVYIHAEDGSYIESFDSADWSNSGQFSFNQSQVPSDGYISVVFKSNAGSSEDYDVVSLQKELIPTQININAKGETVDPNTERCISSQAPQRAVNYTGIINDGGIGAGQFAFSSSIDFEVSSSAASIPFSSIPSQHVLATRYTYSSSPTGFEPLIAYALTTANQTTLNTPLSLKSVDESNLNWNIPLSSVTALSKSALTTYQSGAGALHWQELPSSTSGHYSYAAELKDTYRLNLNGSHNSWNMSYTSKLPTMENGIDEVTKIDNMAIPAPNTSNQLSGLYIESYLQPMPSELNYQRTLIAANEGIYSVHQTIYGNAKQYQPLLMFSNSLDNIWGTSLTKFEVSILSSGNSNQVTEAFISNYFDAYKVTSTGAASASFTDSLAVLKSINSRNEQQSSLKYLENIELSYKN